MSKKAKKHVNWAVIRKAVEAEIAPLAQIARRHGINASTLYRRRKQWRAEQDETRIAASISQSAESAEQGTESPDKNERQTMVSRLYHATDQQIRHLEGRLASGEAAFDEKEARMLGTIARTLDKIMDLEPKQAGNQPLKGSKDQKAKKDAADGDDNERSLDALRTELTQRLERLQQTDQSTLSGQPDTDRIEATSR